MKTKGIRYVFSAKVWYYSTTEGMGGWHIACLPQELAAEIRANLKFLEQGWGQLKVVANVGGTEWETALWFDTKHGTYLLPVKAAVRKKEGIEAGQEVEITIWI